MTVDEKTRVRVRELACGGRFEVTHASGPPAVCRNEETGEPLPFGGMVWFFPSRRAAEAFVKRKGFEVVR